MSAELIAKPAGVTASGIALPWERQPTEPWRAFAAFCAYRDLEDIERTYTNCANQVKRSAAIISRWAKQYQWEDRLNALFEHRDKEEFNLKRVEREKMIKLQATYGRELVEKGMQVIRRTDLNDISVRDAAHLVELGVKTERLARGESTDNVNQGGTVKQVIENKNQININTVINDPRASELACQLFEQLTAVKPSENDTRRVCDVGESQ